VKNSLQLVAALGGVTFANLSGTVQLPSGAGLGGVSVSLRRTAVAATTTNSSGTWTLTTASGLLGRSPVGSSRISSHLFLEHGSLQLRCKGAGIDGRATGGAGEASISSFAPRALASTVDTLTFSLAGSMVARLPIGTLDSTGILIVIDTATPAVDQGTTGNTWATDPAPVTTCKTGTWVADGPDPDHRGTSNSDGTGKFVLAKESATSPSIPTKRWRPPWPTVR